MKQVVDLDNYVSAAYATVRRRIRVDSYSSKAYLTLKSSRERLIKRGGTMCVKVFLADDAEVMRRAIRMLLSGREDMAVVGEASNFRETIQRAAELHLDLIILDVNNHVSRQRFKRSEQRSADLNIGTDNQSANMPL